MHDNEKGAKYLMEASRLPESPYYLATLAARLSVYSAKHRTAVIFLKNMLKDTKNEKIAGQLKLRINTLVLLEWR